MSNRDSYGTVHNDDISSALPLNMRVGYSTDGAAGYMPLMPPPSICQDGSGMAAETPVFVDGIAIQRSKRNRGRPRKYAVDGGSGTMSPPLPPHLEAIFQSSGLSSPTTTPPMASFSGKRSRGRPKGSKGRKQHRFASLGIGFTPHVITVKAGEDVFTKIMSLSQNGTRCVCILSANGAISNVTLRQAAASGRTVTYEGRFEILSLSGSYILLESAGQLRRTGELSALLAGPDGSVLGGIVAGVLTAAAPVQVVVGSFLSGQKDFKSPNQAGPSTAPPNLVPGAPVAGSPVSHGTASEESGEPGSPLNQNTGAYDNDSNQQGLNALSWQ